MTTENKETNEDTEKTESKNVEASPKAQPKIDSSRPKLGFMDKMMNPSLLFRKGSDNQLINEGNLFLKKNRFEEAIAVFQSALEENDRCIDAHVGIGKALSGMGGIKNAKKSIKCFHEALIIDATRLDVYNETIEVYERLGDKKNAAAERKKQFVARTLKSDPNDHKANNNLGIIQLKQKNLDSAIASFTKSLKHNKDFLLAKSNLASAFLQKAGQIEDGEDKEILLKKSMHLLNQVLEKQQTAEACLLKAKVLMSQGENKKAVEFCDQAISKDPAMKEAYNTKSVIEERLGNIGKASQAYENFQSMNRQEQKDTKEKFNSPFE